MPNPESVLDRFERMWFPGPSGRAFDVAAGMNKSEYETIARALTDKTLVRVQYVELQYQNSDGTPLATPSWNWDQRFDSLDFGVLLETAMGLLST